MAEVRRRPKWLGVVGRRGRRWESIESLGVVGCRLDDEGGSAPNPTPQTVRDDDDSSPDHGLLDCVLNQVLALSILDE